MSRRVAGHTTTRASCIMPQCLHRAVVTGFPPYVQSFRQPRPPQNGPRARLQGEGRGWGEDPGESGIPGGGGEWAGSPPCDVPILPPFPPLRSPQPPAAETMRFIGQFGFLPTLHRAYDDDDLKIKFPFFVLDRGLPSGLMGRSRGGLAYVSRQVREPSFRCRAGSEPC